MDKLRQMKQRTRKLMMKHKVFDLRDHIDSKYQEKEEEDSQTSRFVEMQQFKDLRNTLKRTQKD